MTPRAKSPTIGELLESYDDGERRREAFLNRCLEAADERSELNIFISSPKASAPVVDGPEGPLHGVPVAVKDNICTAGLRTTAGSRILEDFRPPEDAEVVTRLKEAGGIVFGKTNLDEFGMGGSTETSLVGPTHHPEFSGRSPGGSSGGSAACVAAGITPAALGSDTGGSIRQPASFCGVVGFRPTWSRVSRRGLIAFASSLDQIGWLTRTVDDACRLFSVCAGPDDRDATSHDEPPPPVDNEHAPRRSVETLRIGIPTDWINSTDIEPAVRRGFDAWRRALVDAGADVVDVEFDHVELATPVYQVIATAEASSNLARYDGIRYGSRGAGESFEASVATARTEGFGREVKRRILLGAYTLSEGHYEAYYERACRVRRLIIDDFRRALADVDVLLTPTTPTTAFELGERTGPLDAYRDDVFTVPASLAGLPAISIPAGCDDRGFPFGLQLVGEAFDEPTLFSAARTLEAFFESERRGTP